MRKHGWFHRRAAGWTPYTWQGWLITTLYLAAHFASAYWGPWWHPVLMLSGVIGPFVVLFAVASLTDDAA